MGWFSDRKAKKADQRAKAEFELDHSKWQETLAIYENAEAVYKAAVQGKDSVDNFLVQKPGEIALWTANAAFHEASKSPSRYVGSSSGFSIPIVAGVRYRVGATRGTLIPGDEFQMEKDTGTVLVTTERIVFTGSLKTQEWVFSKMVGASRSPDNTDYNINVSNRQKASGLRFNPQKGKEFECFLALGMGATEDGISTVFKVLSDEIEKIKKEEPVLVLPSKPSEVIEGPK
jgi:hypothetical protein